MSTRVEIADPIQCAGIASEILQAAWKPPCLLYSVEYLAWQFSFPSDLARAATIAYLDDRPAGCIAVTARRFTVAGETFSAYLLSFVAVHPSASRRGLASAMYRALLDALPRDTPIVAFFEPGSTAERLLMPILQYASFRVRSLLPCRAVGFIARPGNPVEPNVVEEVITDEAFSSAARISSERQTIWTDIHAQHFDHYRRDPRGRAMLVVRDGKGNPVGTAMFVNVEVVSVQGVRRVPMLESVALPDATPAALSALFTSAASRAQPGSTVIASNLSYIDTALLRPAGARALPSSFNAHAFVKGGKHVIETGTALNLEVI